jgi:hypothetical protein
MPKYYKSRYLTDPVVYVQDAGQWSSYAPAGVIRRSAGEIPESILAQTTEIDKAEAENLVAARLADAERIEAQRSESTRYPGYYDRGPTGLKGYLIVAFVWLSLTIVGSWFLLGTTGVLHDEALPAVSDPSAVWYNPAWVPLVVFDFAASAVLFVGSILGIVFLAMKKRVSRPYMIVFSSFALFVALANLVAAASFGVSSLRDAGYWDLADGVIGTQIWQMIGAVWGAVFIPYFLVSKRVKNTLTNPRPSDTRAGLFPSNVMSSRPAGMPPPAVETPASPAAGRYCVKCGRFEPKTEAFCTACGAQLPTWG